MGVGDMYDETLQAEQHPLGDLTPYPCAYECLACRKSARFVRIYLRTTDSFPPCPLCGDRSSWSACDTDDR